MAFVIHLMFRYKKNKVVKEPSKSSKGKLIENLEV